MVIHVHHSGTENEKLLLAVLAKGKPHFPISYVFVILSLEVCEKSLKLFRNCRGKVIKQLMACKQLTCLEEGHMSHDTDQITFLSHT